MMRVTTGDAALPEPTPPDKPRPMVGPFLFFVAVMAIIFNLSLVSVAVIVAIGLVVRMVMRRRAVGRTSAPKGSA